MGLGGISITQLLIVLVIVVLIFGTKRLKGIGSDLGGALKGFRQAMNADEEKKSEGEGKPLEGPDGDAEFPEDKQKNKNHQA
jgi:sec-independent protein translocase protein TatA